MLLIDDALLLRVIAQTAGPDLLTAASRGEVFTTGTWYYRLARATRQAEWTGALSSTLVTMPSVTRLQVVTALESLPEEIGLLEFRVLVPTMAAFRLGTPLNLLAAEALAAAVLLDAEILVATDAPLIRRGAAIMRQPYRVTAG